MLRRLAGMDREEVRVRARSLLHRESGRLAFAVRRPQWRREDLASALRADDPLLGAAVPLLHTRDWDGAHRRVMHAIASRPTRFILDAGNRASRAATIREAFPLAIDEARTAADPILQGRFNLLGYKDLSFSTDGADIDWQFDPVHNTRAPRGYWSTIPYLQPACGDHKIIWELNRHQYWLTLGRAYALTGDHRYRDALIAQSAGWLAQNPPFDGINWASMLELGFRAISWLWALHFFSVRSAEPADETPWTLDLLLGLDRQLTLVADHLSRYFSPNTHLLGEALALYVAGQTLPGFVRARSWAATGRTVLLNEIHHQINDDGGHAERSTHYHRYTLDFYLLALAIARRTEDAAAGPFARAAGRLARFARTFADDNGRFPAIGDEDGGALFPICRRDVADLSDSLQIAATLLDAPELAAGPPAEAAVWMTGEIERQPRAVWQSAALPHTGYYVSRSNRGDQLIVDAGRHGFLNGGHAHADALALTLTVRSRQLLIDPGTGCYTIDREIRDRFRSTPLHNTVTVDGRSQSAPDGPFHWRTEAHGRAHEWRAGGAWDFFEGSHDGYAPLLHHRTVLSRPGRWFVIDRLLGDGTHRADMHWHFAPAWRVTQSSAGTIRAEHDEGDAVWVLSPGAGTVELFRGAEDRMLGWCAPVYGPLVPTAAVRRTIEAPAPFWAVTAIVESVDEPQLELLPAMLAADAGSVAFTVATRDWTETVLFAWPDDTNDTRDHRREMRRAGEIETDARVLCWHEPAGQPGAAAVIIDGTIARRVRRAGDDSRGSSTVTLQATGVA
ncbi:MAG TPA: alginate lyase family protein [Vicinamibacterales bacterium]|nr:alginate lyase family protein [Vicinamibacterales bacterium]